MIRNSYGFAFDVRGAYSLVDVKRGLHKVLTRMFGNYYDKTWLDNRVFLELTTCNVFLENEDLARTLFEVGVVELEKNLCQEFTPSLIFAFYLDDSTGGRGFSLYEVDINRKRIWMDSEFEASKNTGQEIVEEAFRSELKETIDVDGGEELKIYSHEEFKGPIYGQRGIIEKVIRRILLNRFLFDYEWQEYKGDITLVETEDFPIQDLHLLFGD